MNKIVIALVGMLWCTFSSAQFCGNVASQIDIDRLVENREAAKKMGLTKTNDKIYVPVTFHIVAESDGSGGINEDRVISQLCALNIDYAPQNVIFYLKDQTFNYINNTLLFESPSANSSSNKMIENKLGAGKNSMNVFITESADTNSGLGTTLGYYSPFLDVIVIRKSEVGATSGTLSHEAGHFFSLLHTHSGWDSEPWNANDFGIPLSSMISSGGGIAELVDGSNCENAGDMLCDTPADYNLGFGWNGCTTYTGGCQDFEGNLLDPDEVNIMGYFIGCDQYIFSQGQQDAIRADYESSARSYLRVNYTPDETDIDQTTLNFPINGETVESFNIVELDWASVPGAIGYILELRAGVNRTYYMSESSQIVLTDLSANRTYEWKVLAYSEIGGCNGYTDGETFRTGTVSSTNYISEFDINVYPTVTTDREVIIEISDYSSANITLVNLAGSLLSSQSLHLSSGRNTIDFGTEVPQGMYFLNIEIEGKIQTEKLIFN